MDFKGLGLKNIFHDFFKENELLVPTAVQEKIIPLMLNNEDVACISQTGSGKTLSFALPISQKIKELEEEAGLLEEKSAPYALILVPTRELGSQIHSVFKGISHFAKIRAKLLGGQTKGTELSKLKHSSYEILVATPNSVKTAILKKDLNLKNIKMMIFDEADELFNMGFKKDIDAILNHVDSEVQVGFFTATMSEEILLYIGSKFQDKKLTTINLTQDKKLKPKVDTYNIFVNPEEKSQMVKLFLEKTSKGRGIVFCNQKNQAEELFTFLTEKAPHLKFRLLHGDMDKKDREKNFKAFRDSKVQFLVATDLAARGLDVGDLWWVLNLGLPKKPEYYLHRAGRVARNKRKGVVYNLVTPKDSKWIELINLAIKSQTSLDIDFVTKTLSENKKVKAKKNLKTKRIKETKRTKLFGIKKKVKSK